MKVYVLWITRNFLNIKKVSATLLRHISFCKWGTPFGWVDLLEILETHCDDINYDEEDVASSDPVSVSQPKKVSAVSVAFFAFVGHKWCQGIMMNL